MDHTRGASYDCFRQASYLYGEDSGQPAVDTEATEPVGEPIEEVGREPPGPAMPCRLITPLRRIACACEHSNLIFTTWRIAHWLGCGETQGCKEVQQQTTLSGVSQSKPACPTSINSGMPFVWVLAPCKEQ